MRKVYMGAIVAANKAAGSHFFDKSTLRFFNDVPGNWDAWEHEGRTFIRNARHKHGPGAFSHCTLRGQWREVHEDGADIDLPIDEARGLSPLRFGRWLDSQTREG
jgi:hypothetical protein